MEWLDAPLSVAGRDLVQFATHMANEMKRSKNLTTNTVHKAQEIQKHARALDKAIGEILIYLSFNP
jgi:hypothetical protein